MLPNDYSNVVLMVQIDWTLDSLMRKDMFFFLYDKASCS